MIERLTPPQWDDYEEGMLLNVADAKLYYEAYTDVLDKRSEQSGLEIITLDGRVSALEQSTPVGPGGKGAYLNLGGTPERYPTAEEMIAGDTPEETSFIVVARTDGIYFYNPKSKLLIPPKKGGGTVAIHASFPDIFDDGHTIRHDTRIGKSGVYTAKCSDVGLDGAFLSYDTAKILVVTTADMEYQTALHPDGTASRTFTAGNNVTPWSFHTGSDSGGGSIDPVVIQEINRRLAALEAKPDAVGSFEALTDVAVDTVLDVNGLLYLGEDGKVRGGSVNPMLAMGYTPVQAASIGFDSIPVTGNVGALAVVASPVILMKGDVAQEVTLPNIVPFNTYKPSTTQIRAGRMSYFVNASNVEKILKVTSGQRFYKDGNMDSADIVVPAKTTFIYNPAIIDNGSGAMMECFVFIGMTQHQVGASGGAASFVDLTDTPDTFTGNAGKSMIVKADETGIEFIDSPEHGILAALEAGNLPIKWNNLKQKIAAASSNITTSMISENAFTIGLAGQASRFYYLPDIVDANTSPLPANSVREGRLTIISQQGGGIRTVALTEGCKFAVSGVVHANNLTIPPGQSWILLPAVYGNGDKVWSVIGSFSANPLYSDTGSGYVRSSSRSLMTNSVFQTTQINQSGVVHAEVVSISGNSMRYVMFPQVVSWDHTGWIENHQVRLGKTLTVWGSSGGNMTLRANNGQKWLINNVTTDADRTLVPGIMETYMAISHDSEVKWMLLHRRKADGSPVELDEVNTRLTALESNPDTDLSPIHIHLAELDDKHDAQAVEIRAVDTRLMETITNGLAPLASRINDSEVEIVDVKARIKTLEDEPNPSFFDLTNTPTAGRPGEVLSYNLAGNAITSHARITKSTQLDDVPSDLRGNATKLLTVKIDESGFEFTDYPRLAPLQVGIRDNKEAIEAQALEDIEQKVRISSLEDTRTRAGHLPKVFEAGNTIQANGRVGLSGVYTALPASIGLSGVFTAGVMCKVLVALTKDGVELHTAFGEHAIASRVFPAGVNVANWSTDVRDGPLYRGTWDPKTAAYPSSHAEKNSRWDVVFDAGSTTVSFDGKTWRPGDRLIYTKDNKKFTQMHTTLGVPSVNGKTGPVVLTADDVGALKHVTSAVVDCDDLKKAGSFGVAGGSTNWAFGSTAGALIVFFHNSTYMTQLACSAADNKMRIRTCNANRWSTWSKIYSEFEKPTAAEVQAVNLNYGVGAAGKDVADMNVPEMKGGLFNSAANSAGAYANYMPFVQGVRPGGSDGTGQMFQMQANHVTKKLAYRTRIEGNWTDWVETYSKYNKPSASDINAFVQKEWDGDFDTVQESGAYRFSSQFTNGPEDADGGNRPTYSNLLHVKGGGDTQWQMVGDYRGKELWWRGYNDSFINGGTWNRVYHSGRPPTDDELKLPYAARNRYDVRDFGVVGDGVTDDTDAFVRACNTVYGYNGTLTAPGHLHIKLNGVKRTVTVRCNMDLNNAIVDLSDFEGMVMFSRKVIDPVTCWGAGKDPLNPGNPEHPLITALQVEDKLQGGALKGWEDIAEVEDSYFMINTEEPLFSYRGGIKNRCEYNKIGRWGLLESFIKYPMDPKKISRIMYWPMEKQMTTAQNIVWKLGSNDLQSPNVRIRTSNFTAKNWKFLQDNFINTEKNPTVVAVERSANIVMEDISFQWATHSTATTGFTYNIALNDNYNVSLKRVNGTGDGWGATGSNNSRKVYFEQCNLSRIDFHEPMHEYLSLKDCHVGSWGVLATAMGDINIEGGTLFRKRNPRTVDRNGFIRSRTDSGFCDGNISIRNVTIETDQPGVSNLLIHQNDAPDQDFIVPGSPVDFCFWKNITIDNVKFIGPEGSSLNLYPITNCVDMASSGMRWPYAVNITNCTGGNLVLEGSLDNKILPYKEMPNSAQGFIMSVPNHVVNVTESNLKHVDIRDTNPSRRFVVALNMDNINPGEKAVEAPNFKTKFGGSVSLRNSTVNSIDFVDPLAPLLATMDGCKVIHNESFDPNVINGMNPTVELSIVNSVVSTPTRGSLDSVKDGTYHNNRYYIAGVKSDLV